MYIVGPCRMSLLGLFHSKFNRSFGDGPRWSPWPPPEVYALPPPSALTASVVLNSSHRSDHLGAAPSSVGSAASVPADYYRYAASWLTAATRKT